MAHILIIGYGNPLRSDDAVGWLAAEELSQTVDSPNVEIITRHQLMPELAQDLGGNDAVIFIDAANNGRPGELTCAPVIAESGNISSHQISPAGILALARDLYGLRPKAFSIWLCGECFDHGESLSEKVRAVFPALIALVEELVSQVLGESEASSANRPV